MRDVIIYPNHDLFIVLPHWAHWFYQRTQHIIAKQVGDGLAYFAIPRPRWFFRRFIQVGRLSRLEDANQSISLVDYPNEWKELALFAKRYERAEPGEVISLPKGFTVRD